MHEFRRLSRLMGQAWTTMLPSDSPAVSDMLSGRLGFLSLDNPSPILREKLKGSRLIDLGAGGIDSILSMAHLAAALGAKEYVAVDKYRNYDNAMPALEDFIHPTYPGIRLSAVTEDMLVFLGQQPDGSAAVCINGIDSDILRSDDKITQELYLHELMSEVSRVVPLQGIAFGIHSPYLGRLADFGFTRIMKGIGRLDLTWSDGIYEKTSII